MSKRGSEEWKLNIKKGMKEKGNGSGIWKKGDIPWNKNKKLGHYPKERVEKARLSLLGRTLSLDHRNNIGKGCRKNLKIIESSLRCWQDSEYVKKQMKARGVQPNKIEKYLDLFLQKTLPNEYKYVGDGEFILGGKCPDFLNINGQKKLIEYNSDYWHRNDKSNGQGRIDYFKKFGFDTLIIWEKELSNLIELKDKISQFNQI